MEIKGQIVGYNRHGTFGLPEITIAINHSDNNLVVPLMEEVKVVSEKEK